jgi:hypothetical protein
VQERYEKRAPQQFKLHYSGSIAWKRKSAYWVRRKFEPATAKARIQLVDFMKQPPK